MKKFYLIMVCLLVSSFLFSACEFKTSKSTINYKRKFENYLPKEDNKPSGKVIDLSEGPKLNYDSHVGPKDLNFDFKIVNPY